MSADVRLEGISKRFASFQALDNVSFEVEQGTFLTILGPSGSGKTTTLRIIGGFESPDEGHVFLDGAEVTDVPAYKRDINTTFQGYALFPHMTVFQNVAFGLETKRLAKTDVDERVKEALAMVRLGDFGPRSIIGLSGGEQQRIALARAFVNRPKVLLLDEPLGALDLKLRREMQIELKKLQRVLGLTFIYVTHDQEEALSMSDRIIVMNHGRIEQVGPPVNIYHQPSTSFVANFLGESNILHGCVVTCPETAGDVVKVDIGGRHVGASLGSLPSVAPGQDVLLSLRTESVSLGPDAEALANHFEGEISDAIFLGTAWEYVVMLGDSLAVKCWTPAIRGHRHYAPMDKVAVGWATEDIVLVQ